MADVRCLSAHVIKLRDMPAGVLVLSELSQVWKIRICDSVLQGANLWAFMIFFAFLSELVLRSRRSPILMLVLRFLLRPQKQKASTSGATSGHVAKRTRSALAQSSSSTTCHSLFIGGSDDKSDGDDDDACVKIPLVTPLRSFDVIPSLGNQGGSSAALAAEGSNTRDSRGKGIMVDDADVFGDAIHTYFFPFSACPYYATYSECGVVGNCEFTHEEWDAPYQPTFRVLTKEVFKDLVVCKTMVDQLPIPGEIVQLLARYCGLNQSHHEYVLSADSRLKAYEEKSKAKGKERKKKIKSLGKSLDNLHAEVAHLFATLNQATILKAERDEEILRLNTTPTEFSSFFQGQFQGLVQKFHAFDEFSRDEFAMVLKKMVNFMPGAQERLAEASPLDAYVSPPVEKELTMKPASKSIELSTNVDVTTSVVTSKHNEEMVIAKVDESGLKMTDDTITAKSGHAFVHGMFVVLDDAVELVGVGSGCVSSGLNDVVVTLSAGEEGDGLAPSSVVGEEAAVDPFGV
ncbi:hypothetical protein Tco_1457530 [Tanacetum coccineum]